MYSFGCSTADQLPFDSRSLKPLLFLSIGLFIANAWSTSASRMGSFMGWDTRFRVRERAGRGHNGYEKIRQGAGGMSVFIRPIGESVGGHFRCGRDVRRAEYTDHLDHVYFPTFAINGHAETAQEFVINNPSAVGLLKKFALGGCDSLYPARYSTTPCVNVLAKNNV
ncbi:uncharacterized protein EV420DRAFT_1484992 [Desarmillaria tabescens]|uniref:Uncharacterized protein n=1 Tax=Armillaria tabescens TaxID=1929756 RepID=A0AA39MRH8_ARMTA|nr:uncharacterized protein EV420DRAFT_1484992 [Desarmillaria tabescens]KAK0443344.1 hypothetical protein EV420DRAFT_1484992 [Desarmillaria tabescens]